jgi:hypothetical protein
MSPVHSRREFSDGLLKRLAAQPKARPVSGDFAMVCTDLVADTWELFPIALVMTDGTVLQLYDERGGLLSFERVSEREQGLTASAATFPDIEAVRALCWLPFDGLATLRRRLARISAVTE